MILPHNIDLANSQKYVLSIRLAPNGFSFSIYSPTDLSIFFYKEVKFNNSQTYIENIKKVFFEVNLFTQPYNKILITAVTPRYTIIPNEYFDKSKQKDFFNFNFGVNNNKILDDNLSAVDSHLLYEIDNEVFSFLSRNLWNPAYQNSITSLLSEFKEHESDKYERRCFVEFHDKMLSIICFNKSELLVAKTTAVEDSYEAIYIIANTWETLKLDQNSDILFLSGDLSSYDEVGNVLKQLIKHIAIFEIATPTSINNLGDYYPTDFILQLCE